MQVPKRLRNNLKRQVKTVPSSKKMFKNTTGNLLFPEVFLVKITIFYKNENMPFYVDRLKTVREGYDNKKVVI